MPVMRQSKVKHLYGQSNKREDCYDGIKITKISWDSTFCSISSKYLAIITESAGGGSFLVLSLEKTGRIEPQAVPLITGHKAAVLDIQFSPFSDNIIASASEDCTVKVWEIPDDARLDKDPMTVPKYNLESHQRRVGLVIWHPTVENLIFSAGADNQGFLWNVENEEILVSVSFPDVVVCANFNFDGSKLITSCKDKMTRILDPRNGEILGELQSHEGSKPHMVTFAHGDDFITTGFTRRSERQISLWSMSDLSKPKAIFDLDTTNGTLFPFFDRDLNILYLCGKGDSVIRYFEITSDNEYIYPLDQFKSTTAHRGFGWLPKRACNTRINEVGRLYRLHQTGFCEVIPFIIPRKSELFQDDLYPDAVSNVPALQLSEWLDGTNKPPNSISMRPNDDTGSKLKKTASIRPVSGLVTNCKPTTNSNENILAGPKLVANNPISSKHLGNGVSKVEKNSNSHDKEQCLDNKEAARLTTLIEKLQSQMESLNTLVHSLTERVESLEKCLE